MIHVCYKGSDVFALAANKNECERCQQVMGKQTNIRDIHDTTKNYCSYNINLLQVHFTYLCRGKLVDEN